MIVRDTTLDRAYEALRAAKVVLEELRGRYDAEQVLTAIRDALEQLDADKTGS